jgi:hypothetical protein
LNEVKAQIALMYSHFHPAKLPLLRQILQKYQEHECKLLQALYDK